MRYLVLIEEENAGSTRGDTLLTRRLKVGNSDTICLADLNLDVTGFALSATDICDDLAMEGEASIRFEASRQCLIVNALAEGMDSLCVRVCNARVCDTFALRVQVYEGGSDTVRLDINVFQSGEICLDTLELSGTVERIFDACSERNGEAANLLIDDRTLCVQYQGLEPGITEACYVVCDASACDTTFVIIRVSRPAGEEPPIAVDDRETTTKGIAVDIRVLANDTINGQLVQFVPLNLPANGTLVINPDTSIRYTPNVNFCGGIDQFSYTIGNGFGFDTATVFIEVACEDLIIFSGFSPNDDGVNDNWRILGIEDFPQNRVIIFNRWGNEVYNRTGYDNSPMNSFTGEWEGKVLPDGTYFYVIDLGDGNARSGYLQIAR